MVSFLGNTIVAPPYLFLVIGNPHTLTTALTIPGGVIKALETSGAAG